jgi:hypothetical protein
MSGQLAVTAYTKVSGPIADGQADDALDRYAADVREALAKRADELLRAFPMNKTGRARGGFQANLRTLNEGATIRVRAGLRTGVTWGPWLEGASKRNSSTSFKGYHLFRKTRLQVEQEAGEIAERELQQYLPEMGGGQ